MRFDHVAVSTKDISAGVEWYRFHFNAKVLYQDDTWAFLQLGGTKLALVSPHQHPPHIAMSVSEEVLNDAAKIASKPIDLHRDGTKGIYLLDPSGNAVELICYPLGETIYAIREQDVEKKE